MADIISDFSRYKFLIIDDFMAMRTMLKDMLRDNGGRIFDMAANGKEAAALLAHNKYDMVLCDYNLGKGKNGQQLLEEAKVCDWIGPLCAWVMITAEKTPDTVLGAVEYQPDGYLIKPINAELLCKRLGKILQRKSAFAEIDAKLSRKDFQGAIALSDVKMALEPQHASDLMRWKSQLLLSIGELDQARALFEKVLAERDLAWAQVGLAKVLMISGDPEGSSSLLRQVISEHPAHVEAYDLLAQALDKQGNLEDARAILERAAQLSPNSPLRQKNLGELALRCGDEDAAALSFRKSMDVGEFSVLNTPDSCIGLARILGDRKQAEEASRMLRKLPDMFNNNSVRMRAKAVEGMIFQQNNMYSKANEAAIALSNLVKNSPDPADVRASVDAAELFLATGRQSEAVSLLTAVVRNNPDDPTLMAHVQQTFSSAGLAVEGQAWVEQARSEAVTLMNEGVLLARDGKLVEAVASMRRAVAAMPSNVRVLLNCGHVMVLALQVKPDPVLMREARRVLLRANSLSPGEKRFSQLISQLESMNTTV